MTILHDPTLKSLTAEHETRFAPVGFAEGTPSARKPVSPCAACTDKIMRLPFYDDMPYPSKETRITACRIVRAFYDLSLEIGTRWEAPLINSSDEAEIQLEWWSGDTKITLYVKEKGATYIQVWGEDIYNEMKQGEITPKNWNSTLFGLWQWLRL